MRISWACAKVIIINNYLSLISKYINSPIIIHQLFYMLINRIRLLRTGVHTWILRKKTRIEIGKATLVYFKSHILNKGENSSVAIGDNCLIGRSDYCYHAGMPFSTTILCDGKNSRVIVGDNCRINGAYIHAESEITIGKNCVIASGVNIIDSNGHEVGSYNRTAGRDTPRPIIIGNNVWIGMNAIILKGSEIGDNSIVAAGTIVKGHYPMNSIIHTAPAITDEIQFNKE